MGHLARAIMLLSPPGLSEKELDSQKLDLLMVVLSTEKCTYLQRTWAKHGEKVKITILHLPLSLSALQSVLSNSQIELVARWKEYLGMDWSSRTQNSAENGRVWSQWVGVKGPQEQMQFRNNCENNPPNAGSILPFLIFEHFLIFQISGFSVERIWVSPCMNVSFYLTALPFPRFYT